MGVVVGLATAVVVSVLPVGADATVASATPSAATSGSVFVARVCRQPVKVMPSTSIFSTCQAHIYTLSAMSLSILCWASIRRTVPDLERITSDCVEAPRRL